MKIQNSVALVTGANRGLGLAIASALVAAGAKKVYGAARDPSTVNIPGVTPIRLDVTRPEQVAEAVKIATDVNLLVNNAGIARGGDILSSDATATARAEFDTNVFGLLETSRAFAPILLANGGGALVNVLSVLSWVTLPSAASYSASKSAAWSLTNSIRHALRPKGTQVVSVHVGYMDTDMAKHITGPKVRPEDVAAQILADVEAGSEEILADDVSRYVKQGLSAEKGVYLQNPAA